MTTIVDENEAEANFLTLIERVMTGEFITIARAGKPVAILLPITGPLCSDSPASMPAGS